MALESATYVSGLVQANPPGTDAISQGDDHIRLIKKVLLNSFPNADAALNAIHTKATAPSSTSAGLIWFDTTANVLKVRDETDSGWITLGVSPVTSFKLLGSDTVGWTLPTAEGSSGQVLTTNAAGALVFTDNTGEFKGITHAICGASSYIRQDSYYDTGFTITHTKASATTDLYVNVNFYSNYASNFDTGSFQAYLQLTNSSGTIITGTTADLQYIHLDDLEIGSNPTADFSTGYSRWFKVTAANCPDGTTGANTFDIYTKLTAAAKADGGVIVGPGTMMVLEI